MREPGRFLLRAAAALGFSRLRDTLLAPTIADFRHELSESEAGSRRLRVIATGYAALIFASIYYAALLPARHLRENWHGVEAPGPRLLRDAAPRVLVVGLVVLGIVFSEGVPGGLGFTGLLLLLPANAVVVAPLVLGMGVGLALVHDRRNAAAWTSIGLLGVLATFLTYEFVVPKANQTFRVARLEKATGRTELARGDREMTLGQLSTAIDDADAVVCPNDRPSMGCSARSSARFHVERHKRFSLPLLVLSPSMMADRLRRFRPAGILATATWLGCAATFAALSLGDRLSGDAIPNVLAVWAPHLVPIAISMAAAIAVARGRVPSRSA